jgi:hypothetical protein
MPRARPRLVTKVAVAPGASGRLGQARRAAGGRRSASVRSVHDDLVCPLSGFLPAGREEELHAGDKEVPGVRWLNPVARPCGCGGRRPESVPA